MKPAGPTIRLGVLAGFVFGIFGCAASYPALVKVEPATTAPVCLVGGRILLGETLQPTDGLRLCFADGLISQIGPHASSPAPSDATILDVTGQTIMPGLIDTHVHVTATDAPPWAMRLPDPEHNLEAWLHSGITTVYDLGGSPEDLVALRARVDAGELSGPQIFIGHEPITAPNGHPIPAIQALLPWPMGAMMANQVPAIDDPTKADALVGRMHKRGAQYIKLIHDALPPTAPRMKPSVLKALVDAAHARGLSAFVHIGTNQDALEAIAAGADHLAHGIYREPISEAVLRACQEADVTVTFTAAGFENTREMAAGRYQPDASIRATTDPEVFDAVAGESGAAFSELDVLGEFSRSIIDDKTLRDNVSRLYESGVTILPGTDSPIAAVFPGGAYREEIKLMHEAGIPAGTLLHLATVDAARLVQPRGPLVFGVLSVGARADILVVSGDPLTNISAWTNIEHLFAAGRRVTRTAD